MIEREGLGGPALGLRQYVLAVAGLLDAPAWFCEVDVPANAYVALDRRIPRYPELDTALVWDERDGWAAAVESANGDDLVMLAYLDEDVLPAPAAVVAFVRELYADGYPGRPDPPGFRRPGTADGFDERLAGYASLEVRLPEGHA